MRRARYWSVLIPYVPRAFATEWHPTEPTGPFAVLSRGVFPSEGSAIMWAQANLGGTPYQVTSYKL